MGAALREAEANTTLSLGLWSRVLGRLGTPRGNGLRHRRTRDTSAAGQHRVCSRGRAPAVLRAVDFETRSRHPSTPPAAGPQGGQHGRPHLLVVGEGGRAGQGRAELAWQDLAWGWLDPTAALPSCTHPTQVLGTLVAWCLPGLS